MIIPIRTATPVHRTPLANHAILAANILLFMILDLFGGAQSQEFKNQYLVLHTDFPAFHEYFTYQFIHADWMHLAGNMLFLWVFGNAVNAKMGDLAYGLLYLAGGVFAAFAFGINGDADLLGASGAIAGVTTAYLALFPRSHITVLYWLFFVGTFELPALLMIGLKIILWDNIISPQLSGPGQVATSAHLAGYLFGFVATMFLLLIRALPRDQFDMLALLKRWNQRRSYRQLMTDPQTRAAAQYGTVARPVSVTPQQAAAEVARLDQIGGLRLRIAECLDDGDAGAAATLYEQLVAIDPAQCLSARHQITVARDFYASARYPQAAAAFERYVGSYGSTSPEADEIRLLLGIIYARDLRQYEAAERHLEAAWKKCSQGTRRTQCFDWLNKVRQALGKPVIDG